jgi:hypothetical protein
LSAFLFRDDKSITEEGFYCAFLCLHSTQGPFSCNVASSYAQFGFIVTSVGCWNYAALVGSSVTLSLALLVTCIIALIVWRRRRANTSSGNRNRLPSISLPSLGRSRTPRFNKLVNEAEFHNVTSIAQPITRLFSHYDSQVHADEQQFLMGSSAFSPSSV